MSWLLDGLHWVDTNSGDAGDVIYNTMSRIIDMDDQSKWAHWAYYECKQLLAENKRWPNRMNQDNTANNRLQWWWSKLEGDHKYTRPQNDMTRDPYVSVITCALHLGLVNEIEEIKIPWYLYSRATWKWRRTLIRDKQPQWVQRLDYYRALAVVIRNGDDPNIIANQLEAGIFDEETRC